MQCKAALCIPGVFCTSPTGGIEALAGLIPIHLHLKKLVKWSCFRAAILPSQHALISLVSACNSKGTHPHLQSLALFTNAQSAQLRSPLLDTEVSLLNLTECFDPLHSEACPGCRLLDNFSDWGVSFHPCDCSKGSTIKAHFLGVARRAVNAFVHLEQAYSLIVVYTLRDFFTGYSNHSIDFWEYSSKVQWPLHFLVHEDTTNTQIATSWHLSTSFDALCPKSATSCLDAWRTSFSHFLYQSRCFLSLKGGNCKLLQPSYIKGGSWLLFIGKSVTLCTRATWAILNHAPIGGFRQCFFSAECTQCPDFFSDTDSVFC